MSRVKLYVTELVPSRNAEIDNIEAYLSTCVANTLFYDFQYFRHGLTAELTYRLNIGEDSQDALDDLEKFKFNYIAIYNKSEYRTFYYFITSIKWLARDTISLSLMLDTINTFSDIYRNDFDARTTIRREHRDRFYDSLYYGTAKRIVDKENEQLEPIKYVTSRKKVVDANFPKSWYLIYRNIEYKVDEVDKRLPLQCSLLYEDEMFVKKETSIRPAKSVDVSGLASGNNFGAVYIYNAYHASDEVSTAFSVNGVQYAVPRDKTIYELLIEPGSASNSRYYQLYKITYDAVLNPTRVLVTSYDNDSGGAPSKDKITFASCKEFKYVKIPYDIAFPNTNVGRSPIEYNDIMGLTSYLVNAGKEPDRYTLSINAVNKSDPKLNKIICLPYAPTNFSKDSSTNMISYDNDKWYFKEGYLNAYDIRSEFLQNKLKDRDYAFDFGDINLKIPEVNELDNELRNSKYESKLFHSSFFLKQMVYDDKTLDFPYELKVYNPTIATKESTVSFKPTNTINSNFLFKYDGYEDEYLTNQVFPGLLMISRNNEELLLNSSYLNYINNGYNYDKKHRRMDIEEGIMRNTFGLIGQGIALSGKMGSEVGVTGASLVSAFTSNLISGIVSTIHTQIKAEDNMKRNLKDLSNQMVSVGGADDIDLMKFYSDNKLVMVTSNAREEILDNIAKLFHYTGYSHPYQELPNVDSRRWFNYLECDAVFKERTLSLIKDEYLDNIKERLSIGVTFYHNQNNVYDLDQEKENFEVFLYRR